MPKLDLKSLSVKSAWYSDIDMMVKADESGFHFTKKDGSPLSEGENT